MMKNRRRRGVTLIELIMAAFVLGFISLAIMRLQKSVLASSSRMWARNAVTTNTIYCLKNISKAASGASIIRHPEPGRSDKRLLLYYNVSPLDNTAKLLQDRPQSYYFYCIEDSGKKVFKYSGPYPMPLSLSPLVCGQPFENAVLETMLNAEGHNMAVEGLFSRPPGENNRVQLRWLLVSGNERSEVYENIVIEAPL